MGAGLISKIVSGGAAPEADIRMWDNLPLYLSFVAVDVSPGPHTLTVDFLDGANHVIAGMTRTINLNVPAGAVDKVVYVSDKSLTPQTL